MRGNPAFGPVGLSAGLSTATGRCAVRFHQLQRGTSGRVRNRRVNERTGEEIDPLPGRTRASEQERRTAEQLVEAMAVGWGPEDRRDTFQEKVVALIEAKQAGRTVEKPERPAEATNVIDLMEALRAGVSRARRLAETQPRAGPGPEDRPGRRREARPEAGREARPGAGPQACPEPGPQARPGAPEPLEGRAVRRGGGRRDTGRSTMTRDVLIEAFTA
ncbi:hypothetical protein ABZ926_24540 [Streptomyces litmocidini]|uniref:hypothetical protein n=1 Tax=Streptomyces litmocidini TaxID=67318 RepID=UPI0033EE2DB9